MTDSQPTLENTNHHDSHIETLNLAHEQMTWLRSLFSAIRNDTQGYDTKSLSALGDFLTEMWSDSYAVMREDLDKLSA